MTDPVLIVAVALLVAVIDASPLVRIPAGMALAVAVLASHADVAPIVFTGAVGAVAGRLWLAVDARRGRDRLAAASPAARAQRDAIRARLAQSPAYLRITFLLAALPGVPASFVFPLLGAMRAPLLPALLGAFAGRLAVLGVTTTLFTAIARAVEPDDGRAATLLAVVAVLVLVYRAVSLVDWEHRAATGRIRFRDADGNAARLSMLVGGQPGFDTHAPGAGAAPFEDEHEIVEGDVLGEEHDDDSDDDSDPPPPAALPPTGLAPS